MSHSCHIFCDNWALLGLFTNDAFGWGVALLKLPDIVLHKHFEATVSIVCPTAAISWAGFGASGDSDLVRHLVRISFGSRSVPPFAAISLRLTFTWGKTSIRNTRFQPILDAFVLSLAANPYGNLWGRR